MCSPSQRFWSYNANSGIFGQLRLFKILARKFQFFGIGLFGLFRHFGYFLT